MRRLAEDGAEAAAESGRRDVGHRGHGAHVERLGVGAIHRVSRAQQAPIEIFSFSAHPPTLAKRCGSLRPGQETTRDRSPPYRRGVETGPPSRGPGSITLETAKAITVIAGRGGFMGAGGGRAARSPPIGCSVAGLAAAFEGWLDSPPDSVSSRPSSWLSTQRSPRRCGAAPSRVKGCGAAGTPTGCSWGAAAGSTSGSGSG
jgi:hypothetical protein